MNTFISISTEAINTNTNTNTEKVSDCCNAAYDTEMFFCSHCNEHCEAVETVDTFTGMVTEQMVINFLASMSEDDQNELMDNEGLLCGSKLRKAFLAYYGLSDADEIAIYIGDWSDNACYDLNKEISEQYRQDYIQSQIDTHGEDDAQREAYLSHTGRI